MGAIDPLDWVGIALNSASRREAWAKIERQLDAHGLQNSSCTMLSTRNVEFPASDAILGRVISADYERFMREDARRLTKIPGIVRLAMGDTIFPTIQGHPEFEASPTMDREMHAVMHDCGFRGGFTASVHDRANGEMAILTASSIYSHREAMAAYERLAGDFLLAATFFCEGLEMKRLTDTKGAVILSPRERECLLWVAAGRTTRQIADRLALSDRTVDEYIANAMSKLGASSRAQACARAVLLHQIDP